LHVEVFLNVPYDRNFADLFLAYIAGLTALGLVPRVTLEIAGGERRLDRTLDLIQKLPLLAARSFSGRSRCQARCNSPLQHAIRTRLGRCVATGSTEKTYVVCIRG